MTLTELAWLALGAYAIHMIEEYMFDWRNWARAVIRVPVEWGFLHHQRRRHRARYRAG